MKKNIYSIRLTDKHTTMLHRTAKINNCSRAKNSRSCNKWILWN